MPLNDLQPVDLTGLTSLLTTDALGQDLDSIQTDFEQQHYGSTGEHGDVTLDSLAARVVGAKLPISGTLQFLTGAWLFDREGNNDHVAGLRPDEWTGDQHNYNPPGFDRCFMVEVSTDAARSITGFKRIARIKRLFGFWNRGNYDITMEHNHASSESYNRIAGPNGVDLVVGPNEGVLVWYDVGSEIHRIWGVL